MRTCRYLLRRSTGRAWSVRTQFLYTNDDISIANLAGKTVLSNTPPALMRICLAKPLMFIVSRK